MQEVIEKFSQDSVVKNLNKENMYKIINFLEDKNCDYIEDIVYDYLDLFVMQYNDFVQKYNKVNIKYDNKFLQMARENMDLFEEFFYDL